MIAPLVRSSPSRLGCSSFPFFLFSQTLGDFMFHRLIVARYVLFSILASFTNSWQFDKFFTFLQFCLHKSHPCSIQSASVASQSDLCRTFCPFLLSFLDVPFPNVVYDDLLLRIYITVVGYIFHVDGLTVLVGFGRFLPAFLLKSSTDPHR